MNPIRGSHIRSRLLCSQCVESHGVTWSRLGVYDTGRVAIASTGHQLLQSAWRSHIFRPTADSGDRRRGLKLVEHIQRRSMMTFGRHCTEELDAVRTFIHYASASATAHQQRRRMSRSGRHAGEASFMQHE